MSTAPNWSAMRRADFDPTATLALVEARDVTRRVEAAPHANGTEALFGDEPRPARPARRKAPAVAAAPEADALF
ncbi:hypothetical protein ACFVYV_25100 [Streptomyces mirabilis]|uniref:hypothetical protein n=1 Tax=Streptomyces mirabilis TaxID=68239 RepID=UPI0036DB3FBE